MIWLKNVEDFIKNKEWYYKGFLKSYRERVNEYYLEQYNENPESFPFMKPTRVVCIFRDYNIVSFLVHSDSAEDTFSYKIDEFDSYEEYKELDRLPKHLQENRLLEIAELEDYIEKSLSWYGETDDPEPSYDEGQFRHQGGFYADEHYYASRDKGSIGSIDKFNKQLLINRVNNSQFQYELEESINAYNADLFLASTVTAAVALETLLKVSIVNNLGERYLPTSNSQKHTLSYATILLNNKKIDERLKHRIRSLNELRRSSAHSKTGKMEQWDAEQMISGITSVVESLFEETK